MEACRICYEPNNLISVCHCTGTTKYVHKECIIKWIHISKRETCEICHATYSIPDNPSKLQPILPVIFGMLVSAIHTLLLNKQITLFPNDIWPVLALSILVNILHIVLWSAVQIYGVQYQSICIGTWIVTFLSSSLALQDSESLGMASISYILTFGCYLSIVCLTMHTYWLEKQ